MKKPVRVILSEKAKTQFSRIMNKSLMRSIIQKKEFLGSNPQYGVHIEKRKIPKEYFELYDVNNLWKANLSNHYRMVYTLRGNEVEIIVFILDILNHKEYDKKFSYRKN
jgi:hypothetical protein